MNGKWNANRLLCSDPVVTTETVVLLYMANTVSLVQKVIALYLLMHLTEVMNRKQMINLHHHQQGILWALVGCFLKRAEQAAY